MKLSVLSIITRLRWPSFPAAKVTVAKVAQKQALELVAKNAIDHKVDGRVDRNEQITDSGHFIYQDVGHFEDVDHHSQYIKDEEHRHDTQQHRS